MENTQPQQEVVKKEGIKSNLIDFLQSVVIAISICLVIYIFIATPNQIEGQSMQPTFENGEIVLTSKIHQWLGNSAFGQSLGLDYKKGDVVVFQKPGYNDFIKRVIAIPGDKISIRDGRFVVNGEVVADEYLPEGTITQGGTFLLDDGEEKTVPENSYFLSGDNRSNSHDSRYIDIGFIKRDWLKGKVILRYWPINKLTAVNTQAINNTN